MPVLNLSRVKTLEGKPEQGYVLYMHPDKLRLEKGWSYHQEYEHVEGSWDDFVNKLRDIVWNAIKVFKNKDGEPACEITWIGVDEKKKRGYAHFKVKDKIEYIEGDEETLRVMGVRPEIPIIPIVALVVGGIIGFLFGMGIGATLLAVGLLIGGEIGMGVALIGMGMMVFVLASGIYKAIGIVPAVAGGYVLAKHFGVIK